MTGYEDRLTKGDLLFEDLSGFKSTQAKNTVYRRRWAEMRVVRRWTVETDEKPTAIILASLLYHHLNSHKMSV